MPKQILQQGRRWYVIHTYSGYEENVKRNLEQRIESMDMEDKIFSVLIPTEKKIKIKNGKRKIVTEKIFPGYVLVEMVVDDNSWYVVRNTPNVTGFRSVWAWKSQPSKLTYWSANRCASPMDRLKGTKERLTKLTMRAEKLKY